MTPAAKIGLFVLMGLIGLGVFILKIEDIPIGERGDRLTVRAEFPTVAGIDRKADVRIAGVRVGKVEDVELVGGRAMLTLSLDPSVRLHQGASVRVSSLGMLGDKFVEISPGDLSAPPLPPDAVLGDCWHRFYVRMLEVVQSMDLVQQGIERYRAAPPSIGAPIRLNQRLPKGEAYLETEAPKGQIGYYVVADGTAIPWRVRIRSSSFCNLSTASALCRGCLIADVPAIIGSLDVVLGEIDR